MWICSNKRMCFRKVNLNMLLQDPAVCEALLFSNLLDRTCLQFRAYWHFLFSVQCHFSRLWNAILKETGVSSLLAKNWALILSNPPVTFTLNFKSDASMNLIQWTGELWSPMVHLQKLPLELAMLHIVALHRPDICYESGTAWYTYDVCICVCVCVFVVGCRQAS